jgi:hypothetical protein
VGDTKGAWRGALESGNKKIEYVIIASAALLCLLVIKTWWAFFFVVDYSDAGYYLSCAERIYEGWKPYRDFTVAYPPVGLYYFSFLRALFGGGYVLYKGALLVLQIISAFLVYLLSGVLVKSRSLRFWGALFFLFICLAYEGYFIVLEPFVNVFSVIAILLLMSNKEKCMFSLIAGISFFLAVMSKQYAIVIIPVLLILLFKDGEGLPLEFKSGLRRTFFFLTGFLSAFVVLIFYLDVDVWRMVAQLRGTGYGSNGIAAMAASLMTIKNVWMPIVVVSGLIMLSRKFRFSLFIVVLLCLLNFLLLYIRVYPHYYQLILPYATVLLLYIIQGALSGNHMFGKTYRYVICIIFLGISLAYTFIYILDNAAGGKLYERMIHRKYVPRHMATINDYADVARQINRIVPQGSPVMVINEPIFSYLCNFKPPTHEQGYGWVSSEKDKIDIDMSTIDTIVWFKGRMITHEFFLKKIGDSHRMLNSFRHRNGMHVEIWVRK